jgi:hypothetical protein
VEHRQQKAGSPGIAHRGIGLFIRAFTRRRGDNIAALMARIAAMEASAAELHNQMLASSELIQTLADQNAQLIKHIEDNRMRIKWLTRAAVIFGIVTILGLVLALAR